MPTISGKVFNASNTPVTGRTVRAYRRDTGALLATAVSGFAVSSSEPIGYTGAAVPWVVPAGVTEVQVKLWGGGGGGSAEANSLGGGAGHVYGTLAVTPGETLTMFVARGGYLGSNSRTGAGGGGSTAILRGGTVLAEAGGGGGGMNARGGAGGGASGQAAETNAQTNTPAGGGTQVAPGAAGSGERANGFPGSGHNGGDGWQQSGYLSPAAFGYGYGGRGGLDNSDAGGSGGGGGYFGGGGGGKGAGGLPGGGGSGFVGGLTAAGNVTGNYQTPGGSADPDRAGAGVGGGLAADGANGRIVLSYATPDGGYTLTTSYTGEVQVVCLDDDAGTVENDQVLRTIPE